MKKFFLLTFSLFSVYSGICQGTSGLIAHWDMNGSANDVSGNMHTGHAVNVTPTTGKDGVPNTAYYFNGVNSMITAPYLPDLNVSQFSICAVVKVMGYNAGLCQSNIIVTRGNAPAHTAGSYCLAFDDNMYDSSCTNVDTLQDVFWGGAPLTPAYYAQSYYTPTIANNIWYTVVTVFNDSSFKTYVNGVLKVWASVTHAGTPIGSSTDSISIGYDVYGGLTYPYPFKGVIDDIKIYSRALTDSEAVHYGDTCGRITTQPVSSTTITGHTATFSVSTSISSPVYQWQQDAGLGFVNLTNAGPYSGVNTATLTISGVTSTMNNNHYRCIILNTNGCTDTTDIAILLTVPATGIEHLSADAIKIYPNPVQDNLIIDISSGQDKFNVEMINAVGQIVLSESITENHTNINLKRLPSGIYTARIEAGGNVVHKRVVKN